MNSENKRAKEGYKLKKHYTQSSEKLYKAFLNESILKEIWGVESIKIDLKTKKAYAKFIADGTDWSFQIFYLALEEYEKIKWKVKFDSFPEKEVFTTLQFKEKHEGSELSVRLENFESVEELEANKSSWEQALEKLAGLLNSKRE